MLFGVTLAKRCTRRQKAIFCSQIIPLFEKLGYVVTFQKAQGMLDQTTNLVIGNIKTARTVVMCPYDTPTRTLFPYKYYPFNWKNNLRQETIHLGINFVIYLILGGLVFSILSYLSGAHTVFSAIGSVVFVLLILFSSALIGGLPNTVNLNKNSASLALVVWLAQQLAESTCTCFVLLDHNASSSAGLRLLAKEESIQNKFVIYLDCVANGEEFAFVHDELATTDVNRLVDSFSDLVITDKLIPSDKKRETSLQFFPRMVHICVGSIERQRFVVKDTRSKKDFQVNLPQLEKIQEGLLSFLKG